MVGKSLTWTENYSGWKATNSDMVGNFPQGVRKGVPSHRTFSLVHPSYRREFPILFSISIYMPFREFKRHYLAFYILFQDYCKFCIKEATTVVSCIDVFCFLIGPYTACITHYGMYTFNFYRLGVCRPHIRTHGQLWA